MKGLAGLVTTATTGWRPRTFHEYLDLVCRDQQRRLLMSAAESRAFEEAAEAEQMRAELAHLDWGIA